MPFNLSTGEIVVLLIVSVIVFGGRLPEVARAVGRTFAEVRRGVSDEMRRIDVDDKTIDDGPPTTWEPPPDGADCDGFGGPKPPEEETVDTEPPSETTEAEPEEKS